LILQNDHFTIYFQPKVIRTALSSPSNFLPMTRSTAIRQRKLNTKTGLAVISEDQLEGVDDEIQRNVPKIDTGVEQAEQNVRLSTLVF